MLKKKEISELTANILQGILDSIIDQSSFCKQYIADNANIKSSKDKKTNSFLDEHMKCIRKRLVMKLDKGGGRKNFKKI